MSESQNQANSDQLYQDALAKANGDTATLARDALTRAEALRIENEGLKARLAKPNAPQAAQASQAKPAARRHRSCI